MAPLLGAGAGAVLHPLHEEAEQSSQPEDNVEAGADISLSILFELQAGQFISVKSILVVKNNSSNRFPHFLQENSYIGIVIILPDYTESIAL